MIKVMDNIHSFLHVMNEAEFMINADTINNEGKLQSLEFIEKKNILL